MNHKWLICSLFTLLLALIQAVEGKRTTVTKYYTKTKYTKTATKTLSPLTVIVYHSTTAKTQTLTALKSSTVKPSPKATSTVRSYKYIHKTVTSTRTFGVTATRSNFFTYTVQ